MGQMGRNDYLVMLPLLCRCVGVLLAYVTCELYCVVVVHGYCNSEGKEKLSKTFRFVGLFNNLPDSASLCVYVCRCLYLLPPNGLK